MALGAGAPVVVYTIIALCVASFLLQRTGAAGEWTTRWVFAPFIGEEEPWRFLTAGFLHGGFLHLALNMYALWAVGSFLEQSLGRIRFAALFLLSVLGGSVAVLLLANPMADSWWIPVLGASGGVFGLFSAVVFELRRLGGNAQSMLIIIGINLVYGFVFSGVSWQGHLGGLVTGAVLGLVYSRLQKPSQKALSYGATAAVGIALVALAVAKYAAVGW